MTERLVPWKFEIHWSLLGWDDESREPVAEYMQEPFVLFGTEKVREWLDQLPQKIAEAEIGR